MTRFRKWLRSASLLTVTAGITYVAIASSSAAQAQMPATTDACDRIAEVTFEGIEIVAAKSEPAQLPVEGVHLFGGMMGKPELGPAVKGLPAFCRVSGRIRPEPGSNIRFEVWMPAQNWNGRLSGLGIGGFAGSIDYLGLSSAVKAGQVGMATDTGHAGSMVDSTWAAGHPERVRDYGWRAIHVSTVAAKEITAAYYGSAPEHAYFVGCSGGGRQGLMEASRYPEDYDGVLAGAPAAVWTDLAIAMINPIQAQSLPGATIRTAQTRTLQDEVLRQCDALDGQVDGLVADPPRCNLSLAKLACGVNASSECFTPAQLKALEKIYAGPHDRWHHQLAPGYPPSGAEVGAPNGWDGYILHGASGSPNGEVLIAALLRDLVQNPFATPETFDFNKDPARLRAALAADLDAGPDLHRFFDRAGKLILWHGWADGAIPPEATLKFYEAIRRSSGSRTNDSMRLFMVPGVQHCEGGTGADVFGQANAPSPGDTPDRSMSAALQAWVETDREPETFVARRGGGAMMGMPEAKPERQRLLCAYPLQSVLLPGADPDKASSYTCRSTSPVKISATPRERRNPS
jgi:hypothetical protein